MNTKTITSWEIMRIGAIGGISLAVLKLIESGFYLGNALGTTAVAAYMTYIAYVFLGMVVACFFAERDLADDKLKKNAFVLGLLAPSVLLAISVRPIGEDAPVDNPLKGIPNLGALLIRSAWAACPPGQVPLETGGCVKAELLTKQELEPTFRQALKMALGRGQLPEKYSFVIGTTPDAKMAAKVASEINQSILQAPSEFDKGAKVVKPQGTDRFFVTIGGPSNKAEIADISNSIRAAAIEALKSVKNPMVENSAELVLRGQVVETKLLL